MSVMANLMRKFYPFEYQITKLRSFRVRGCLCNWVTSGNNISADILVGNQIHEVNSKRLNKFLQIQSRLSTSSMFCMGYHNSLLGNEQYQKYFPEEDPLLSVNNSEANAGHERRVVIYSNITLSTDFNDLFPKFDPQTIFCK